MINEKQEIEILEKAKMGQLFGAAFFSLVWTGILSFMVYMASSSGMPMQAYFIFIIFFAIGALPLWLTLRKHGDKSYKVSRTAVQHVFKRTLRSPIEWTEPLSNYAGLFTGTVQINMGTSKHSNHVTFFVVDLLHDDVKKRVRLAMFRDEVSQRARAEELSKILNKEIIVKQVDGSLKKVSVEDLDKKFQERVSVQDVEGALPPFPKSKRYSVITNTNGFTIKRGYPNAIYWSITFAISALVIGITLHPGPAVVLSILAVLSFGTGNKGGTYLILDQETIESYTLFFGKKIQLVILKINEVEEIIDAHDMTKGNVKTFNICVQIKSDKGIISIAHGASPEIRSWIKKAISKYVFAMQKRSH